MRVMSAETVQQGWVPTTDFGTRLLLARKHARLTVREAAARSGVHYATWSTWERGARPADMAGEVNKISQALGVDRAWLMWGAVELPRLDSNQQPAGHKESQVTGLAAYRDRRRRQDRRRRSAPLRTHSGMPAVALTQLKAS